MRRWRGHGRRRATTWQVRDSQHPTASFAGPHRVTVHHVSEQYPHVNTGAYTLDDAVRYDVGTREIDIGDDALVIDLASRAQGLRRAGLSSTALVCPVRDEVG